MRFLTILGLGLLAPKGEGDEGGGGAGAGSGDGSPAAPLISGVGGAPAGGKGPAGQQPRPAGKQSEDQGGDISAAEVINMTKEQLNDRLARANKSQLKKLFGTDDPAAITERWKKLGEYEAAEEERRLESMTEIERHKSDAEAAKAEAAKAAEELAELKLSKHVSDLCVKHSIKNLKYARFLVTEHAGTVPEGEEFDADEYLQKCLEDPDYKSALGMAEKVVEAPVSSSPTPGGTPPPPPKPGAGDNGGKKNAGDMTREEFARHLASLGVGQPGV